MGDPAGRLETVETPSGSAQYQYYVNGSRKSLTLPNQVTTTYIYDDLLRLDKVEHRDSGLDLLAEFDYTVGRTGKRSGVAEEIDGVTSAWQYEYDGLGRICDATRETSGSAAVVYDYQYDLVGNRTEKSVGATTTTYTYNALDQLKTETSPGGVINYDYDENGNLKSKQTSSETLHYVYNSRNRLEQVYQNSIETQNLLVEYAYDFAQNRYAKSTRVGQDFEHKRFLIDTNNLSGYSQTLLEYEYYTGAVEKRYEYGDDLYCEATPLPSSPVNGGGDVTNAYFLYDGLGSTRSLTNSDGELTQSYNYHPFGEGIDQPQNPSTNHLFTGEFFDQDLSYYYLRARYYAPSQGRFTGFDPVEDQANKLHKYLYCGNDAVNCVDLSGSLLIEILLVSLLIGTIVAASVMITSFCEYLMYIKQKKGFSQKVWDEFEKMQKVYRDLVKEKREDGWTYGTWGNIIQFDRMFIGLLQRWEDKKGGCIDWQEELWKKLDDHFNGGRDLEFWNFGYIRMLHNVICLFFFPMPHNAVVVWHKDRSWVSFVFDPWKDGTARTWTLAGWKNAFYGWHTWTLNHVYASKVTND